MRTRTGHARATKGHAGSATSFTMTDAARLAAAPAARRRSVSASATTSHRMPVGSWWPLPAYSATTSGFHA